ncbi:MULTISPECIES: glutathione S-transferase [unclassified Burkholderia]|uniref:glutathione S-transferase family protein n=1 Tax=unclassified Burkholderia TaxID=2613784 RepID=UPI00075C4C1F|nr:MULTISPECIES: glutathione S-transferase [unclassified Burkholderia]AOI97485.1 glutathione S-transferase [Burkholderia sp. LA-2-3-30-S1-D2]KVE17575.1 glutathione S-transferase [Burkholderia sp. LA-2-3-30-S1-D2]RQR76735.1 glutathione S-transferase family protein [Burkholderia sp. Bp9012]RQZ65788.1 glutathione S-transferase family protein [Burkholderia sp. Bp9004]
MLQLCGIPLSNYYNKVKFVLLEHDIPFEEMACSLPISDPALLADSPLGKIPFLKTEEGALFESQVIIEYLAARYPDKAIFPAGPFAAAKVRELVETLELYLEWTTREVYTEAFFGGKVSDGTKAHVEKRLPRSIDAFKRMTQFSPYVLGDTFSLADIAATIHLPVIGMATKAIFGRDFLLDAGIDWKAHAKLVGERPAAQRVAADRKAYVEATSAARS